MGDDEKLSNNKEKKDEDKTAPKNGDPDNKIESGDEEKDDKQQLPSKEAKEFIKDVVEEQEGKIELIDRGEASKREFTPIHVVPSIDYSFGNLDAYLHYEYRDYSPLVRNTAELIIISVLFMFLPFMLLVFYSPESISDMLRGTLNIKIKELDYFFKTNLFVTATYICFVVCGLFMNNLLYIIVLFLTVIDVRIEGSVARFLQIICSSTNNLKNTMAAGLIFLLADKLYGPYQFLAEKMDFNHFFLTVIFWYTCFSFILFLENLIMNIFFGELGRASFGARIFDANSKTFVFKKLLAIGEARQRGKEAEEQLIDEMSNEMESCIFLKHNDLKLASVESAKEIAESIFGYLDTDTIKHDEIVRYFPDNYEEVYRYLSLGRDSDEKPPIDLEAAKELTVSLYRERLDIMQSLADRDKILKRLNVILLLISSFLAILLLFFLINVDYKFYLASVGPFLFAFGWIFQDSIKELYRCFVFLLISHPFDNGDRIEVDGVEYEVKDIDLLYTTGENSNGRLVYLPNSVLFSKNIANLRRSNIEREDVVLFVSKGTTITQAMDFKTKLADALKKSEGDFTGVVFIKSFEAKDDRMELVLNVQHNANFQEVFQKYTRRESFIKTLESELSSVGISYTHSYSFN